MNAIGISAAIGLLSFVWLQVFGVHWNWALLASLPIAAAAYFAYYYLLNRVVQRAARRPRPRDE